MQYPRKRFAIGLVLMLLGMLLNGCRTPTIPSQAALPAGTTAAAATAQATATTTAAATLPAIQDVTCSPLPEPTVTGTPALRVTPIPSPIAPTSTPTPSPAPPEPTVTLTATAMPSPSVTLLPASPVPAPAATRTRRPPTPTTPPHRFLPAGPAQPDPSHLCGCPLAPAFIVGRVVDAAGNPLAGVRLVCYNEWHRYPVVASKGGGEYDFNVTQAETTWYVVVLDEADSSISPEVPVRFKLSESCRYILDWQRTD